MQLGGINVNADIETAVLYCMISDAECVDCNHYGMETSPDAKT